MKYFRLLSAGALLALLGPAASAQTTINISTSLNAATSTLYPVCGSDQYWQITNIPVAGFSTPMCAVPITSLNTGFNGFSTFRAISASCTQSALTSAFWGATSSGGGYAPITPPKYIRFTRRFYLNSAGSVRLSITKGFADDFFRMAFDASTGTPIPAGSIFNSGTGSSTYGMAGLPFNSAFVPMSAGWHTVDMDVYDISGQEISMGIEGSLTVQNTTITHQANNPCSWVPPSDNVCSDVCYWRVTGNNILNGNNIFGTLTQDDVRIQTSSDDQGIITRDGLLGWNTMNPTAWLHVDCSAHNDGDMSDIRFEHLEPFDHGNILIIREDGYVFDSRIPIQQVFKMQQAYNFEKTQNEAMQNDIRELKAQLAELTGRKANPTGTVQDRSMLYQNTPNPFSNETVIDYYVSNMSKNAYIMVYDLNGKELKRLPVTASGKGSVKLSSESMLSGMYIYSLIIDGREADSKRMVLVK